MDYHPGYTCDVCNKINFRGHRYKCLRCANYDLCRECYEKRAVSKNHSPEDAMQCVLAPADIAICYGSDALHNTEQTLSYTCPFCTQMGYSASQLLEHVSLEHSDAEVDVICPICACLPNGGRNMVTGDFLGHMVAAHRFKRPTDPIRIIEDTTSLLSSVPTGRTLSEERLSHGSILPLEGSQSSDDNQSALSARANRGRHVRIAATQNFGHSDALPGADTELCTPRPLVRRHGGISERIAARTARTRSRNQDLAVRNGHTDLQVLPVFPQDGLLSIPEPEANSSTCNFQFYMPEPSTSVALKKTERPNKPPDDRTLLLTNSLRLSSNSADSTATERSNRSQFVQALMLSTLASGSLETTESPSTSR